MSFELRRFGLLLPLLVLIAVVEALLIRRWRRGSFDVRESAASLAIAVGQKVVAIAGAGVTAGILAIAWEHRLFTMPLDSAWSLALLFIGSEWCYYWQHRASHEVRWFWTSHSVHHSSNHFNLSAAYRLGWTAGLSGAALFFLPLVIVGFNPVAVALMLTLNLLYQFWLHTELVPTLGAFEWLFNTPAHHRVHHASNTEYLDHNYGGVLIVFDRMFGTLAKQANNVTIRYGLVRPVHSYNPLVIVFHEWIALLRDIRHARTVRDVVASLFGRPGALPPPSSQNPLATRTSPGRHMPSRMLQGALAATLCVIGGAVAFAQGDAPLPSKATSKRARIAERFAAADVDRDGRLTRNEAKVGMPMVSRKFDDIDQAHKGYVTLDNIAAFVRQRMQQRARDSGASR